MTASNPLRKIARSARWQILYARCKELSGLKLFENESEFTPVQIAFLQWLEIYSSMETDLAMKEKNISREVIEDDIRADAYLYCRNLKEKNKSEKEPQEGYEAPSSTPGVVFNRG